MITPSRFTPVEPEWNNKDTIGLVNYRGHTNNAEDLEQLLYRVGLGVAKYHGGFHPFAGHKTRLPLPIASLASDTIPPGSNLKTHNVNLSISGRTYLTGLRKNSDSWSSSWEGIIYRYTVTTANKREIRFALWANYGGGEPELASGSKAYPALVHDRRPPPLGSTGERTDLTVMEMKLDNLPASNLSPLLLDYRHQFYFPYLTFDRIERMIDGQPTAWAESADDPKLPSKMKAVVLEIFEKLLEIQSDLAKKSL